MMPIDTTNVDGRVGTPDFCPLQIGDFVVLQVGTKYGICRVALADGHGMMTHYRRWNGIIMQRTAVPDLSSTFWGVPARRFVSPDTVWGAIVARRGDPFDTLERVQRFLSDFPRHAAEDPDHA